MQEDPGFLLVAVSVGSYGSVAAISAVGAALRLSRTSAPDASWAT
ncbi:hypothetical protein ACFRCW_28390 [Streptomyces sp. NPDC056653]